MKSKIQIIFEDDLILVLDKPAGLVVNRSGTIKEETLQDQIAQYFHLGGGLGIGGRAGIVHRLDRETSGLMVVAKTEKAFRNLQSQFKAREVVKVYLGLVHGSVLGSGSIELPIGRVGSFGKFGVVKDGRGSKTEYQLDGLYKLKQEVFEGLSEGSNKNRKRYLVNYAKNYSLLSIYPKTGRTHQIRVHLKSIGNLVVSDLIYGPRKLLRFDLLWCPRLFLHAKRLEFEHPRSKKHLIFKSDLPNDLKNAMLNLTSND